MPQGFGLRRPPALLTRSAALPKRRRNDTVRNALARLRAFGGLALVALFVTEIQASDLSVRWKTNNPNPVVEVRGVSNATLRALSEWQPSQWQKLLSVYAGQDLSANSSTAMLGTYRVEENVI